ncbi:MAG: hypothetical protein PHQ80_00780 [Candidatus ainarchaeum sp.]|nr:hypothetical protein [Candidatus ainarchaeum sp.]
MVGTQVARVLLHKVPAQVPQKRKEKPNIDPILEAYARKGVVITSRADERTLQLICVGLVADSLRRLLPSKEGEISKAEKEACSEAKRKDGAPAVVWPKGEFLAHLPGNLPQVAMSKFTDAGIMDASKRIFLQLKDEAGAKQVRAAPPAQHPAQAQASAEAA